MQCKRDSLISQKKHIEDLLKKTLMETYWSFQLKEKEEKKLKTLSLKRDENKLIYIHNLLENLDMFPTKEKNVKNWKL